MRLELSEATSCYQWVHDTRCCSSENRVVGLNPTDCVSVLRTIDMIGLRPAAQRGTLSASCSGEVSAAMHIPTDSTRSRSRLYVRGPLRLLNEDGVDCTPKGGFRKALLALLVLSENQCRGRAWLQSVLWESSNEKRAAAGLRTALSVLRRELKEGLGFDPIVADSQSITIELDTIWVDVLHDIQSHRTALLRDACELLEGLNLRATGGESFEDWLRAERQFWATRTPPETVQNIHPSSAASTTLIRSIPPSSTVMTLRDYTAGSEDSDNPKSPYKSPQQPKSVHGVAEPSHTEPTQTNTSIASSARPGVGLLPVIVVSGGPATYLFADAILDCMAGDLSSFGNIDVYDYREESHRQFEPNDGLGPQLLVRIKVAVENQQFSIHLCTFQATTQKVLGTGSVGGDFTEGLSIDNLIVSGFVAQNVDRILAWFDNPGKSGISEPGTPYQVLNTMFRFDQTSHQTAEALLQITPTESQQTVQIALRAYLQTFCVGEHWGELHKGVYANTRDLVSQVLVANPQNPIALCATGHALGFTLHEHELAIDLLRRSVQLGPTQAFCLDHLALAHLYLGHYDNAMKYAKRAIQVGAFSPLRFTYETTLCMIATLQGDYKSAVHYGKRALSRRPSYGAALRYTSISLAHLDRVDEAAMLLLRTGDWDDEFSMDWIDQGRLGVADSNAKITIKTGLRKIGTH